MTKKNLETRAKIVQAAKKVFAEQGYDASSIRSITSEADVNLSALNYHFGTKDDLLKDILKDFSSRFLECSSYLKPCKTEEEFKIRLDILFRQLLDLSMNDPHPVQIFMKEQDKIFNQFAEVVLGSFLEFRQRFIIFLKSAKEEGVIRQDAHEDVFCKLFIYNLKGELSECVHTKKFGLPSIQDPEFREIWIEQSLKYFWNALKPEEVKNEK